MRPVYAGRHPYFQHLVSLCNRFIDDVHIEFAGGVREFFKFQELKLDAERRILHFECPGNFPVWTKPMDYSIGLKHHSSPGVGGK